MNHAAPGARRLYVLAKAERPPFPGRRGTAPCP
jgi:hypothetical protein